MQFDGAVNTTNPWKGPPSENLDAAWSELFEGEYDDPVAISTVSNMGNSGPDGSHPRSVAENRKDQHGDPYGTWPPSR